MANKKWIVYCHRNKINGKRYIGITSQKNPNSRWKNGYGYKPDKQGNQNIAFWNAILKYGWDSFEHIILADNLTEEQAKEKEKYYIEYYQTFIGFFKKEDRKGYNSTLGGDGTCGICGTLHHNYGKTLSEEHKELLKNINSKPIDEYSSNGILVKTCKSSKEACDFYNIDSKSMWELLNGKRISLHNKIFRYCEEPLEKYRTNKLDMSKDKHPMYGRKHSMDSINKMRENRKGKLTGSKNHNSQKVKCDEEIFSCIRECQEYLGIPYTTLVCWLRGRNPMPDEYIQRGLSLIQRK